MKTLKIADLSFQPPPVATMAGKKIDRCHRTSGDLEAPPLQIETRENGCGKTEKKKKRKVKEEKRRSEAFVENGGESRSEGAATVLAENGVKDGGKRRKLGDGGALEEAIENGEKKKKKETDVEGEGVEEKLEDLQKGNGVVVSGKGSGEAKYAALASFAQSKLPGDVLKCCENFSKPSPIQSNSWPFLLDGRDFIGIAATGSGFVSLPSSLVNAFAGRSLNSV